MSGPGPDQTDPRYSLANERTFLAYERTSVGLVVAAVAVLHLIDGSWGQKVLGFGLLLASLVTALAGWQRYREADRAIREGRPLGPGVGVPVVVMTVLIVIVLVALTVTV